MTQAQVEQSRRDDVEFDEAVALAIEFMKQQQRDWLAIKRAAAQGDGKSSANECPPHGKSAAN